MAFTVVIPARYASTRLPGKPLASIGDRPMLQHVWERAGASGAERVVIATDDARIRDAAAEWGAAVLLTRDDHPSGTDRLAEVAADAAQRAGVTPDVMLRYLANFRYHLMPPDRDGLATFAQHLEPGIDLSELRYGDA